MGWALVIIGGILILVGVRDEGEAFGDLVSRDILGEGEGTPNFILFAVAVFVIGLIGAVRELRGFSDGFLALIFVALLLSNRGFFAEFERAIRS